MAPYSMDLRERVLAAWDRCGDANVVAAQFAVSRAWVHRLVQRRRESGEIGPRKQTRWRTPLLAGREEELTRLVRERPDRTLVELREALQVTVGLSTLWRAVDRLGFTFKKNGTRRRTAATRRPRRAG